MYEPRTLYRPASTEYNAYLPAMSPDDSRLAFVRSTGGASAEIWLVGSDLRRLSEDHARVIESEPLFTPDGRYIVHTSNRGGSTNIWRTRLSDGWSEQLTTGAGPDNGISMTSDGSIAFLNSRWRQALLLYPAGSDDGHSWERSGDSRTSRIRDQEIAFTLGIRDQEIAPTYWLLCFDESHDVARRVAELGEGDHVGDHRHVLHHLGAGGLDLLQVARRIVDLDVDGRERLVGAGDAPARAAKSTLPDALAATPARPVLDGSVASGQLPSNTGARFSTNACAARA